MNTTPTGEHRQDNALTEEAVTATLLGAPHSFLDVGHSKLAHWRFGGGPDVLCVHGWPLHGATFRRIIPALARRFTVHVIDLPGTGRSEWSGRSLIDLASHGATVRRASELLGLERFAMVAHDSGAAIARLAAADHPGVVGLVMGNTEIPGYHAWQLAVYKALTVLPGKGRLLFSSMKIGPIRRSSLGFGGCFSDPLYGDGVFGDLFVRPLFDTPRLMEGQLRLVHGFDPVVIDQLGRVHQRIDAPVLCLWGTDDPFFPLAKARAMLGSFRGGAELIEIPGGKLFAHEDHPEEFAARSVAFLERAFERSPRAR